MRSFVHPQGCVTLLVEDCQQGRLTWAFGVEVLLGLSHILPTWLTFVSRTAHRFALIPLLSRLERICYSKARIINHIVRLSGGQSTQTSKDTSNQSTSWPKDNFPVAESKGQISLWVNSSQGGIWTRWNKLFHLVLYCFSYTKTFSEITSVALKRKKHVLIGFDTNLGVLTRTQNYIGS